MPSLVTQLINLFAAVLLLLSPDLDQWQQWPARERILRLGLCVATGTVCYFAVLRLATFGDVQAGHDFQAGHDRASITLGDFHIFKTIAVDTEPDERLAFFPVGLDVNIRSVLSEGVSDNLVGKTNDGAVVFIKTTPCRGFFQRFGLGFSDEFPENV